MAEISKWQKQDCSNMEKTEKTLPNMWTIVQPGNGLGYPSHCAKNTRGNAVSQTALHVVAAGPETQQMMGAENINRRRNVMNTSPIK